MYAVCIIHAHLVSHMWDQIECIGICIVADKIGRKKLCINRIYQIVHHRGNSFFFCSIPVSRVMNFDKYNIGKINVYNVHWRCLKGNNHKCRMSYLINEPDNITSTPYESHQNIQFRHFVLRSSIGNGKLKMWRKWIFDGLHPAAERKFEEISLKAYKMWMRLSQNGRE